MSKRSVQRLFERDDATLTQHIARKRVEHVLARLRDPWYDGTSLDEIAQATGLSNAISLRRAVRRQTGLTPTQYRSVVRAERDRMTAEQDAGVEARAHGSTAA